MTALFLLADGFEDLTLFAPLFRLREDGHDVRLASPLLTAATGEHGYRVEPDLRLHEVVPSEYDLLVVPDGRAVERLRVRAEAVDVVRTFVGDGRPVAAVGHGPQLLLSAGVLDGRSVTCSPGIRDDVRAAGASYHDDPVVLDGPLLTGRGPDDLPEFCGRLVRLLRARVRAG